MLIIPWPDTTRSIIPGHRYASIPDARTAGTSTPALPVPSRSPASWKAVKAPTDR